MKFHPAALILTWCLLVAIMQFLSHEMLLVSAGFVFLFALLLSSRKLLQLLRRTRWIMLSLLLIYAYTTPGMPLMDALGMFSPSREGLDDGVLQLTRLLAALADFGDIAGPVAQATVDCRPVHFARSAAVDRGIA